MCVLCIYLCRENTRKLPRVITQRVDLSDGVSMSPVDLGDSVRDFYRALTKTDSSNIGFDINMVTQAHTHMYSTNITFLLSNQFYNLSDRMD